MRVLITGSGGLVGSALATFLAPRHDVLARRHDELDITNGAAVVRELAKASPDVVINCAVVGVETCESDPDLAELINVEGPRMLARAAAEAGATIIHFSTNYVFDGERDDLESYEPGDEAVAINVYGGSKLRGEAAVLAECEQAAVIRTSWVFGRGANTFLSTLPSKLKSRERVSAITDRFASVTYVRDLVVRVEELMGAAARGVFHVANSGACSYAEFADAAAALVGLSDEERRSCIEYVQATDVAGKAQRPRWTPMRDSAAAERGFAPLRSWRDALAAYCREE